MKWKKDDGGRSKYFRGKELVGDCVARSIAIATGKDYLEVYNALAEGNAKQRVTKYTPKGLARKRSARDGVLTDRKWFKDYMRSLGFEWYTLYVFGGRGKLTREAIPYSHLPKGRLVVKTRNHLAAVIDTVLHDTWDSSANGTATVYGYWKLKIT